MYENFVGTLETVRNRKVPVPRGSTVYVVVQFYSSFKFYFPLFWGMVMYVNEFETKENKN